MKKELNEIFERVLVEAGVVDFKNAEIAPIDFDTEESIFRMKESLRGAIEFLENERLSEIIPFGQRKIPDVNLSLGEDDFIPLEKELVVLNAVVAFTDDYIPLEEELVAVKKEGEDIESVNVIFSDAFSDDAEVLIVPTSAKGTMTDETKEKINGGIIGLSRVKTPIVEIGKKDLSAKKSLKLDKKNERRRVEFNTDSSLTYSEKRNLINKILKSGQDICFNYEKKDQTVRAVMVCWNPEYTYDIPDEDSDFTYLYDFEAGIFKHFKLDKIMYIEFIYG